MDTLDIQAQIVRDARAFSAGVPIVVSPITLLPHEPAGREIDPRAREPFGSAWTVGSLANLVTAGAASLTYELGDALAGPMSMRGNEVLEVSSSAPRQVVALATARTGHDTLLLANLTASPATVDVRDLLELPAYGTKRVRL
jgi:hypothetical protein